MRFLCRHRPKRKFVLVIALLIGVLLLGSVIPVRLAIARHQAPHPQAMLVLEGNTDRIRFAANFARSHPDVPLWISGNPEGLDLNQEIFRQAQIDSDRLHYDFCATDTVTNFTCNVDAFTNAEIQHAYVITSDYHMSRSVAIATLVFGSHGITVTPVSVPSGGRAPESDLRTLRDCIRCFLWLLTGWTAANLNPDLW